MQSVVTVRNISDIEYTALVELLHDVYCRDVPEVDVHIPLQPLHLEQLMIFFSNQYSYMIELWATMSYQVRLLKRTSANKDAIDEAMAKRDYLEKVMSACKLKYYACSGLYKGLKDETSK